MTRFEPDTWRDALLRPLAMATPDSMVYVEFPAPDIRFVVALVFAAVLLGLWAWRHWRQIFSPTAGLRALCVLAGLNFLAFVPWLYMSGNGRYLLPFLLVVGPVCVGLIHRLPATPEMRMLVSAAVLGWQAYNLVLLGPFQQLGLVAWRQAPYFALEFPADMKSRPATYVTMHTLSFSLIGPMLHPDSRWINISSVEGGPEGTPDNPMIRAFLEKPDPRPLTLLAAAVSAGAGKDQLPNDIAVMAIEEIMRGARLRIQRPIQQHCRYIPAGKSSLTDAASAAETVRRIPSHGFSFWACDLERGDAPGVESMAPRPHRYLAVFEAVERACPRFFLPGGGRTVRLVDGELRSYINTDMRLYVLDQGIVMYRYLRALNPVPIGSIDDVLSGKAVPNCKHIRGRSGLPWEREI